MKPWLRFCVGAVLTALFTGAAHAQLAPAKADYEAVLSRDQIEAADPDQLVMVATLRRRIDRAANNARALWRDGDCDGLDFAKGQLVVMSTPKDQWPEGSAKEGNVFLRRSQAEAVRTYAAKMLTQIASLPCPPPASSADANLLYRLDRRGRLVLVDGEPPTSGAYRIGRDGELVPVRDGGAPPVQKEGLDIPPSDRCIRPDRRVSSLPPGAPATTGICYSGWLGGTYSVVSENSVFGSGTVVNGGEHFGARIPGTIDRTGFELGGRLNLPGSGWIAGGSGYISAGFGYASGSASGSGTPPSASTV